MCLNLALSLRGLLSERERIRWLNTQEISREKRETLSTKSSRPSLQEESSTLRLLHQSRTLSLISLGMRRDLSMLLSLHLRRSLLRSLGSLSEPFFFASQWPHSERAPKCLPRTSGRRVLTALTETSIAHTKTSLAHPEMLHTIALIQKRNSSFTHILRRKPAKKSQELIIATLRKRLRLSLSMNLKSMKSSAEKSLIKR